MSKNARWWIAEQAGRARKTILVKASCRREAQSILDSGGGEGVDISYYRFGYARVVREDKKRRKK